MTDSADSTLPTTTFSADLAKLQEDGFRLDMIYPADEPRVAELSRDGETIRLEVPVEHTAPPVFNDELVLTRGGTWGEGRAGMQYRDLIPNRHGGNVIASHIRIVEPGPVPDYVHHHDIRFQMIYCRRGRVQVIYEDQGGAFWMEAGDCVLQPPHIRHRVLASENACEVVEIASPSEHPTFVEHDIELPTPTLDPGRDFGGQRFSFDRSGEMAWVDGDRGWRTQSTGIEAATAGLASVKVMKAATADATISGSHSGDLFMFYVLEGSGSLTHNGSTNELTGDDSVAIPQGQPWQLAAPAGDLTILVVEVT